MLSIDEVIEKIEEWKYRNKELMISLIYNKEDNEIFNWGFIQKNKIFYNKFYDEIYKLIKKYNLKKENIYLFDNYYIFNIDNKIIKNIFTYKLWKKPTVSLNEIVKEFYS